MPAISGPNWNGTGVDLPNTTGVGAGSGDSLPWGFFDMVFFKISCVDCWFVTSWAG